MVTTARRIYYLTCKSVPQASTRVLHWHYDRVHADPEADVDLAALERVDPQSETLPVTTPPRGAARLPASPGLTDMGVLLGTPLYMSPEQWLNRAVDARSDVYALGLIAYRMLAGEPPLMGKTASLSIEPIRKPPPPDPRA